jgi:S-adenosylmethionine-diacylgycerolhomoserine-N-methlytransferase
MAAAPAAPPAADLMNRIYRRQRHIYDATRKYFLLGRDRIIAGLDAGDGTKVLEIGCGTGRNLIAAARRYPAARFFGLDVSTEMLDRARGAIARAGLGSQITLACGDATAFDPQQMFGTGEFERIFISYTLSMIPDWQRSLEVAILLLANDGELWMVDFGGQERLPAALRLMLRRWLAWFHVTPRDRLEAVLRAHSAALGAPLRFERPYRDYAQCAVLRRPSRKAALTAAA